ncbi:adenylate/guanylate cyclase domain-containing protein [Flavisolibacter tropicus]|uniref:adenylate/guanylate cyclase domain-containing protein n=1 Tax=Flavisolibacter tropicus TaxID=1492898 RepID=UPI00083304D3|nr:adenylate/guanylate cyclase domain-containing protein [Flavisolibacter tropicus]
MAEENSQKDVNYYGNIDYHLSKLNEIANLVEEQNKRFQVIASSKNDAIITSDETKKIVFWNKGAEYIFGYSAEEAVGQPLTLIIPRALHQRHDEGIERMNQRKEPPVLGHVLELNAVKKNGEEFPIELTLGSWDNDGKRYYSGIIRDISEKKKAELLILEEKKKSDELLLNILPKQVADELKSQGKATTKLFENVSILFTDFQDFTQMSSSISPTKLVDELNEIFGHFDDIMERLQMEKIETIGDAYFAACGVPEINEDHAFHCVEAAKQMFRYLEERNKKNELQWKMRAGIHSGPVVAAVVGKKKYAYDLFGDTVNTASRMETNGEVGKINISETTYELIKGRYNCIPRGKINAKGKGDLNMYFVE